MGTYKEIKGDLITLARQGEFQVISHGCNCQNTMGAGIAPLMAKNFGCDRFPMEHESFRGNINKLGTIDYKVLYVSPMGVYPADYTGLSTQELRYPLIVVNSYTQYNYGKNYLDPSKPPFDYEAFILCMRKINKLFSGKSIGLPKIGCGLAGGNWDIVKVIIKRELHSMDVTIVIL